MERQIRNAVDAGDGDFRVRELRGKLALDPKDWKTRFELATYYQSQGYPELALDHLRLATAHDPSLGEAHLAIAKNLRDLGLRRDAVKELTVFLESYPQGAPEYSSWLGLLFDELGEWSLGEEYHRAALALWPQAAYLHNNLGYNLLRQGKSNEAAGRFRQALKLEPDSTVARNNLGIAVASDKREAILHWQSVAGPVVAHTNMAALLIEQGLFAEARRELQTALSYDRSYPAALHNLEVVAELDGQPVAIPIGPARSRWSKFWGGLRRALGGTGEVHRPEAAGAASRRHKG
jgi:Tfp pilus assembly protein PilF